MPERALTNRAVSTISTELEFLQELGMLSKPQFQSIMAQLPKKGAIPSPYMDPRFNPSRAQQFDPSTISREALDSKNPAHPDHPKHEEWAKKMVAKFGNVDLFKA